MKLSSIALAACAILSGCGRGASVERDRAPDPTPNVVTAEIQAGIEKHIGDQTRMGGGYFTVDFDGKKLKLKLVRVHTEYLANLGPRSHFACVDLADEKGDVYDVDFFLEGDHGNMSVTETMVHKFNGQPYFVWDQDADKNWIRVPVGTATRGQLDVVTGSDEFDFFYRATLPELNESARMWIPFPETDAFQTVEVKSIDAPGKRRVLEERRYGNKILFLELAPEDGGKTLDILYHVRRAEKSPYDGITPAPDKFLAPESLVPANEVFRQIAEKAADGKKGDLERARALYDHVIDQMRYMKYGSGWGKGDAAYACSALSGNCTDFHSYFAALARTIGIPARFAIGAAIPARRDDGGIDGYHCWMEFHAGGKWWPVDISEADKYSSQADYYFGHHPANRFEFSRGRDLVVEPGPASGPINFLAYPVLEIGGKPARAKVEFSFKRKPGGNDSK